MENDKEKWIDEVFDSLTGLQRAKPDAGLFTKIENQVYGREATIIPIYKLRIVAAAAALLLLLNVFIISQYSQNIDLYSNEILNDASEQTLVSDYNIYDR